MKFKAIIYQNYPKKIHGSLKKINLFGLKNDYLFEEEKNVR